MEKKTYNCPYCDVEFQRVGRQKFCCVDHGRRYRRNQYEGERKTYGDVVCEMCPRWIRRVQPNHKYCSPECARRGLNAKRKTQPAYISKRKRKKRAKKLTGNALWHSLKD